MSAGLTARELGAAFFVFCDNKSITNQKEFENFLIKIQKIEYIGTKYVYNGRENDIAIDNVI